MTLPQLKDWKSELEKGIQSRGQTQEDLLAVIYWCEDTLQDMQPAFNFVREQRGIIDEWLRQYRQLYLVRFHEEPPPRLQKHDGIEHLLIDTPEMRKQAVREVALALAQPGEEVTDKQVLETLIAQGKRLDAHNPAATISTILNGFKSHFEKVPGKRGFFKRREVAPR